LPSESVLTLLIEGNKKIKPKTIKAKFLITDIVSIVNLNHLIDQPLCLLARARNKKIGQTVKKSHLIFGIFFAVKFAISLKLGGYTNVGQGFIL
jgi:hypothetical protein